VTAEISHELRAAGETTWAVVVEGFDPLTERGAEAVLSVANGHFGVRAALEEGNPASNPMVVVAGIYVPTKSPAQQTLLELPDPSSFEVTVDGQPLQMSSVRTVEHVRHLDLRGGTSMRTWSFVDGEGRSWRWESLRAASATQKECYFYQLRLALEEGDAPVKVVLSLPRGAVLTSGRRDHETQMLVARDARTPQLFRAMSLVHAGHTNIVDGSITALVEPGRPLTMNSVSHIMGSDGNEEKEECGFEWLFVDHKRTWKERWNRRHASPPIT
jgi:trehalose/maltose hydrolase-like predicted phosphorylase